jgi:hypothetical protein
VRQTHPCQRCCSERISELACVTHGIESGRERWLSSFDCSRYVGLNLQGVGLREPTDIEPWLTRARTADWPREIGPASRLRVLLARLTGVRERASESSAGDAEGHRRAALNARRNGRMPPVYALRATRALPRLVRGPVDFSHGFHWRIASAWRLRRSSDQPFSIDNSNSLL